MDGIRWGDGSRCRLIQLWWQAASTVPVASADDAWTPMEIPGVDSARRALGSPKEQERPLRAVLAATGCGDVFRLTGHQVLERVAHKLVQRELVLYARLAQPASHSVDVAPAPAPAFRGVPARPVSEPSYRAPPRGFASAPRDRMATIDQAVHSSASHELESFDHDLQADSLWEAAQFEKPFCEICLRQSSAARMDRHE